MDTRSKPLSVDSIAHGYMLKASSSSPSSVPARARCFLGPRECRLVCKAARVHRVKAVAPSPHNTSPLFSQQAAWQPMHGRAAPVCFGVLLQWLAALRRHHPVVAGRHQRGARRGAGATATSLIMFPVFPCCRCIMAFQRCDCLGACQLPGLTGLPAVPSNSHFGANGWLVRFPLCVAAS